MQKLFRRGIDSLEDIFAFIQEFFSREEIDRKHLFSVNLAAEELFTNMVKYNPGNANEILISLCKVDDQLRLTLIDSDVDAFDVTGFHSEPPGRPLKDLQRGRLGLRLVRRIVDSMTYDYQNRQSRITVTKHLR